ncbi:MAG: zinc transporter ZupT [Candidatus Margulisiibacteriota bacterium]
MNITYAILLSLFAGLSTTFGSFIATFLKKPGARFMALTLGFSAGVMVYISFVELLQNGILQVGFAIANLAFLVGILCMFLLDILIPHHYLAERYDIKTAKHGKNLARTGLLVALGIGIHNFPEGLVTFVGTLQSLKLGFAIAIAIALHNIPEGIAVSAPVYAATGSRRQAFYWSFLSGLAEPLGAIIAALFLLPFLNAWVMGLVLAFVAGIMVFIAIDELLPVSHSYGHEHLSIAGFVGGMIIMAVSLWIMNIV